MACDDVASRQFFLGSPDEWHGWMDGCDVMPKKAPLYAVLTQSINTMHTLAAPHSPSRSRARVHLIFVVKAFAGSQPSELGGMVNVQSSYDRAYYVNMGGRVGEEEEAAARLSLSIPLLFGTLICEETFYPLQSLQIPSERSRNVRNFKTIAMDHIT